MASLPWSIRALAWWHGDRGYFRNLAPTGILSPTFALDERTRLVPRCECWKQRPRWTVMRVAWLWWRCVDCDKYGRKEML